MAGSFQRVFGFLEVEMLNIIEVIADTFQRICKYNYAIDLISNNIVRVAFEKFALVLYYSDYEYELIVNYAHNDEEYSLNKILLALGCDKKNIPAFRFMSNENIAREYLKEYVLLINNYYTKLSI